MRQIALCGGSNTDLINTVLLSKQPKNEPILNNQTFRNFIFDCFDNKGYLFHLIKQSNSVANCNLLVLHLVTFFLYRSRG